MAAIRDFMERNFKHFNARETVAAARAYADHVAAGRKMLLAMAGAMSTAELGISLARMIREDKIHAVSCTAANLEEDLFNLLAHDDYATIPRWRELAAEDEVELARQGFNRVTDTCIPESVMRELEGRLLELWQRAEQENRARFPWEFCYELIRSGTLEPHYQIDPADSWVVAACERDLPIYTPGFEDSTIGNVFAASAVAGKLSSHRAVRSGTEQMAHLVGWYLENCGPDGAGFFQIGGGIAGDFAICAVPLIIQDLKRKDCPLWSYFAQISDSTTSYGSYSGAVPNEKITWYKLDAETPRFLIESDASIVAPLVFAYVLGD